ncbi:MAG: hypothetical protein IJY28_00320 [Clostridia bacterium]|nr:hypothetical protein [Clostridia bacterium]
MKIKEIIRNCRGMLNWSLPELELTQGRGQIRWDMKKNTIFYRPLTEEGVTDAPENDIRMGVTLVPTKKIKACRRRVLRALRQLPMTDRTTIPDGTSCEHYLICTRGNKTRYYAGVRREDGAAAQNPVDPAFTEIYETLSVFCDFTDAADYDCALAPAECGEAPADPDETVWICVCGHPNRMIDTTCAKCDKAQ